MLTLFWILVREQINLFAAILAARVELRRMSCLLISLLIFTRNLESIYFCDVVNKLMLVDRLSLQVVSWTVTSVLNYLIRWWGLLVILTVWFWLTTTDWIAWLAGLFLFFYIFTRSLRYFCLLFGYRFHIYLPALSPNIILEIIFLITFQITRRDTLFVSSWWQNIHRLNQFLKPGLLDCSLYFLRAFKWIKRAGTSMKNLTLTRTILIEALAIILTVRRFFEFDPQISKRIVWHGLDLSQIYFMLFELFGLGIWRHN